MGGDKLHVSTFATTGMALPTGIEHGRTPEESPTQVRTHFSAVGRSPCLDSRNQSHGADKRKGCRSTGGKQPKNQSANHDAT
jgi:hypothetical protein